MGKRKSFYYWLGVALLLVVLVAGFRVPLLKACASLLIKEDKLEKADAIFVLGGNAWDRGAGAAALFHKGYASRIICTGEHVSSDLRIVRILLTESELTRQQAINHRVPADSIHCLKTGTSTHEEAALIVQYARVKGYKKVIIVSSAFHTRRVSNTFSGAFRESGIKVIVHGIRNRSYNESNWWKSESGLIAVNNEYIKLMYYILKY
jgi:uncharacterized SAM-binding protein YcdF (DUF218 family)